MTADEGGPDEPDWLIAEREEAIVWATAQDDRPVANGNGHAPHYADQPSRNDLVIPEEQIRSSLLVGKAILDVPPPEPLIDNWLNLDSFAMLFGKPKSGKSFLALDMSLCVATGSWWQNNPVHAGPVLYVVAEGVRGIGRRVASWCSANNVNNIDRLTWLPRSVNLLSADWVRPLIAVATEIRPALIVIDTLNRSMPGGDENASKDMSTVIAACDQLRRATGACVLIVHHSGKNAEQGARGHSSLLGAVDTELELKSTDNYITLTNSAQKDAAEARPLYLALTPFGESVAITSRQRAEGVDFTITANGDKALDALRSIELPEGIPAGAWQAACELAPRSFYDQRSRLLKHGMVVNVARSGPARYLAADSQYVSHQETPENQGETA